MSSWSKLLCADHQILWIITHIIPCILFGTCHRNACCSVHNRLHVRDIITCSTSFLSYTSLCHMITAGIFRLCHMIRFSGGGWLHVRNQNAKRAFNKHTYVIIISLPGDVIRKTFWIAWKLILINRHVFLQAGRGWVLCYCVLWV